jgi:ribosomal protein S18 acetylase RimI-like enzyme
VPTDHIKPPLSAPARIRVCTAADHAACAALITGQPLFVPYGLTPDVLKESLAAAAGREEQILLAELDEQVLGFVWFMPRGAFGRSAYLRLLVTAAAAQGRGIGSLLMDAAETAVFAEVSDLFLLVNSTNLAARRFYERRGYRKAGELASYVAPGLDEVLLRKTVTGPA